MHTVIACVSNVLHRLVYSKYYAIDAQTPPQHRIYTSKHAFKSLLLVSSFPPLGLAFGGLPGLGRFGTVWNAFGTFLELLWNFSGEILAPSG